MSTIKIGKPPRPPRSEILVYIEPMLGYYVIGYRATNPRDPTGRGVTLHYPARVTTDAIQTKDVSGVGYSIHPIHGIRMLTINEDRYLGHGPPTDYLAEKYEQWVEATQQHNKEEPE